MPSEIMNVTVIIVTYNGEKWIRKCLDSIYDSSMRCNIVVVDNCSQDSTADILKEYPTVATIELKNNIGFGQANNIGIYFALENGADYVFLVNQDTHLDKNCIEELVSAFQLSVGYGIISPVHLSYDGKNLDPSFSSSMRKANSELLSSYLANLELNIIDVQYVAAAFWFMSRDVLIDVGGFDPVYFLYGEDNDLIRRINAKGYKVGVHVPALAYHYHSNYSNPQNEEEVQKRWLFDELVEIIKRPDSRLAISYLRLFRRILGHMLSTTVNGFGSSLRLILRVAIGVINKRQQVAISRKYIFQKSAFLSKDYIENILTPLSGNELSKEFSKEE